MNAGAIRSMKVTGKAIMLCSYGINIKVMANLMLVQCVIASHAEVWICQFCVEILSGIVSDPWYRSQKERQCQLKVNIMSNRKKVMLTKDAPLSSHLAVYVL